MTTPPAGQVQASTQPSKVVPATGIQKPNLPDRIGQNKNPAAKAGLQKGTRRTPQQVAADREAKEEALRRKAQQFDNAKKRFAEMQFAEDEEIEAKITGNLQQLALGKKKQQPGSYIESEGEVFEELDADVEETESDESEPVPVKVTDLPFTSTPKLT